MREIKLKELKKYVEELKTIKFEINENPKKKFIKTICYKFTLNNGRCIPREQIIKNNTDGSAVIIAPIDKETGEFLVVVEPRVFTEFGVAVSFPAGYIDEGEKADIAALRELREETGYVPQELIHLDSFYQDEGASKAFNHAFLALNCEKKYNQNLGENEIVKYMTLNYDELLEVEKMGYLSGSNTKLTLCRIKDYLNK